VSVGRDKEKYIRLVPMSAKSAAAAASPLAASSEDVTSYGASNTELTPEHAPAAAPRLSNADVPLVASESGFLRQRSQSEVVDPWNVQDGGGQATYLPAIPAVSASPAPAATKRKAPSKDVGANNLQQRLLDDESTIGSDAHSLADGPRDDADVEAGADDGDEADAVPSYVPPPVSSHHKLGQWQSTAICGNDITSSCLYVTGLCVADAGVWAPVCLLMVGITLYFFRAVYGEAVTALPLNGGAYNVLLNTTSKSTAAVAACLTILSYVATAVCLETKPSSTVRSCGSTCPSCLAPFCCWASSRASI